MPFFAAAANSIFIMRFKRLLRPSGQDSGLTPKRVNLVSVSGSWKCLTLRRMSRVSSSGSR